MQLARLNQQGTNFVNWSKSVRRALADRSKLELITNSFPEPPPFQLGTIRSG